MNLSVRYPTSDTQAVLLLTSRLSSRSETSAEPLTRGEYNRFAKALHAAGFRPADLLSSRAAQFIDDPAAHGFQTRRLRELLGRGVALATASETWTNAGFWIMSRADEDSYPSRLRARLKGHAPVLLYGCGDPALLGSGGLAIVGSRNVDEVGSEFTRHAARAAAGASIQVISGGARGVDSIAMEAALERGGSVIGVLASDLAKTSRSSAARDAVSDGRLCLVSPSAPESRFEAWRAMDRNKVIYALSDWALVVSSDLRKGGTWAGAKENLDNCWVPLFVRAGGQLPVGNRALLDLGGRPLCIDDVGDLTSHLRDAELTCMESADPVDSGQLELF